MCFIKGDDFIIMSEVVFFYFIYIGSVGGLSDEFVFIVVVIGSVNVISYYIFLGGFILI